MVGGKSSFLPPRKKSWGEKIAAWGGIVVAKFLFSPHGGGHFPPMVRGKFVRFSPHGGGFSSEFGVFGGT